MELTLETPRLRVRPFRGEDEAALAEILGDPAVMAWIEPPYTPEQTRRFLARAGLGEEKLIWAVLSRDAGRLVGQLIFHPWTGEAWELGWSDGLEVWRRELSPAAGKGAREEYGTGLAGSDH